MSRKNTPMSLKEFHGGCIPSDIALPSAPGVNPRHSDRSGFDRYSSRGNPVGRFASHLRPVSSPASRNFDDKTPFHSTARIGRNFDEDERKPLDAASFGPRRTVSDDNLYPSSSQVGLKPDAYSLKISQATNGAGASSVFPSQPKQMSRFQTPTVVAEAPKAVDMPGGGAQMVNRPQHPNAWAARREAAENAEMASSLLPGPSIFSKLAQASALEKVSSGRWQSKQTVQYHADVEVIHHDNEPVADFQPRGIGYNVYTRSEKSNVRDQFGGTTMDGQMNKSLFVDGLKWSSGKESSNNEMSGADATKFRQSIFEDGKAINRSVTALTSNASERPKLKLLPRTKPLEVSELPRIKQGNTISDEIDFESHENVVSVRDSPALEKGNQLSERPKLNLKPRSQPVDQMEGISENRRNTLFGGARPRELVLKDRGVDDGNSPGKAGPEKGGVDQRWNPREPQERERSPDTWRRRAEQQQQLRPCSPMEQGVAVRNGKVASAAELAHTFSRSSVSDSNRSSAMTIPDQARPSPVLFSRLVGPTTRSSINGY